MCTVTWIRETDDSYVLISNRDEGRDRLRARPPEIETIAGTQILTPRDADAGGTWIAANEHGTTVCLLNRQGVSPQQKPRSRGLLVRDLADSIDAAQTVRRLESFSLSVYRPFTLIAVDPGTQTLLWWDGEKLSRDPSPSPPLASSSHKTWPTVISARRELWMRMQPRDAQTLLDYHRSHEPERGLRSPCMHRLLAATVSLTKVRVTAQDVEMTYVDGPPCRTTTESALTMPRR